MKQLNFRTLRSRILLPLLGTAVIAALLVATVSGYLGRRWATNEVMDRFVRIKTTLDQSAFPLTASVLRSIAVLTDAGMVAVGDEDTIISETQTLAMEDRRTLIGMVKEKWNDEPISVDIQGRPYQMFAVPRSGRTLQNDGVSTVLVLFDKSVIDRSSRQAAVLPLVTGFSTILLMTLVMVFITRHLVQRLVRLQQGMERVASGDFAFTVGDSTTDEVGRLGTAIDSMTQQLAQLWKQVHRQEGAKLLHQIASGMAHQLRNTLTGSRMAIELHHQDCPAQNQDDIGVALRQMEVAEDYVRRLLLLGTGRLEKDQPSDVLVCLRDVHSSFVPIANHLKVKLRWDDGNIIASGMIADGPNFSAAISNLVMNAVQAATEVDVSIVVNDGVCVTEVADNGPGIDASLAEELFEPFVTSKPEGIGLGLALVKRVANQLGGQVTWRRDTSRTIFRFECPIETESQ